MPATRDLAARLGISRYTVGVAYDRLVADGFVRGRTGAGSFVTDQQTYPAQRVRPAAALRPNPIWESITEPFVVLLIVAGVAAVALGEVRDGLLVHVI